MSRYFYDNQEELTINSSGLLPHWNQRGKMQFVTFRLIDSLPQTKLRELLDMKQHFLANNPLPWSKEVEIKYWKLISPFESKLPDNGYGNCILKAPSVRKIVADSLRYWDGRKYDLVAFVIMPNHIHLLILLHEEYTIESIIHSIKSFTSNEINIMTTHSGPIWMKEYFDRIIRSGLHLKSCINYILENPKHLRTEDFELYINPDYLKWRQDAAAPL